MNDFNIKYMALQPIEGKNGTGYDRGSIFTICPPWGIESKGYLEHPYLTITPVEQIFSNKGYTQPDIFPFNHGVFKLFNKIKNEKNWFLKLCDHDFDWDYKKLVAKCKKCSKKFIVKKEGPGSYTINTVYDEVSAYRNQFGRG